MSAAALAARCGQLAAFELLAARGATAELDPVDAAVLAVARGESVRLPTAPAPALGNPDGDGYGWILARSLSSAAPTWFGRCSTAACTWTSDAEATSLHWIRPPCTAEPAPCSC
jgi:hypothetical protein